MSTPRRVPFFRECVFDTPSPDQIPFASDWDWMFDIAGEWAHDCEWPDMFGGAAEDLLVRVDTRTHGRECVLGRSGKTVVTTLRPWGGLGAQPYGLDNNPAGCELLRILMRLAEEG